MELIIKIFGEGKDLNVYQMSARGLVIYFITLVFIRISGRRTFGKRSAFDNTIVIILGAILSRAVVGASAFLPTIICSLCLVLLHRLLAWICLFSEPFARLLRGESMQLYKNGKFYEDKMKTGLVSKNELMSDLRMHGQANTFSTVDEIFMETNGEIGVVKKENR